jgi:hypothetical protein
MYLYAKDNCDSRVLNSNNSSSTTSASETFGLCPVHGNSVCDYTQHTAAGRFCSANHTIDDACDGAGQSQQRHNIYILITL